MKKILFYLKRNFSSFSKRPKNREITFFLNKNLWLKIIFSLLRETIFILKNSKISEKSAQLTYISILSIVPLIAILFSFIHAFQGFNILINEFISPTISKHFGNQAGKEIILYLNSIISNLKLKELGIISFATFLFTVILLILKVEDNIDDLMEFRNKSKLINRIIKCWLILTITPFIFTLASLKSDSFLKLLNIEKNSIFSGFTVHSFRISIGLFFQWFFFSLIFYIFPSKKVSLRSALLGGFISNILFALLSLVNVYFAKRALATDPSHIYGSVAIIAVLFFVWIRLIWIIILIGASVTKASEKIIFYKESMKNIFSPLKTMQDCLLLYKTIKYFYKHQNSPIAETALIASTGIAIQEAEIYLQYLIKKNIICCAEGSIKNTYYLPTYQTIRKDNDDPEFLRELFFDENLINSKEFKEIARIFN